MAATSAKKSRIKVAAEHKPGILPAQAIRGLIEAGVIKLANPLVDKQLQPASLDLRLGRVAYRVRASFLAGPGATVKQRLDENQGYYLSCLGKNVRISAQIQDQTARGVLLIKSVELCEKGRIDGFMAELKAGGVALRESELRKLAQLEADSRDLTPEEAAAWLGPGKAKLPKANPRSP